MNGKELLEAARLEIDRENDKEKFRLIKNRLKELDAAKLVVKKMEESLDKLMNSDANEHVFNS